MQPLPFVEAGLMAKMAGGGGGSSENEFDRIAKLPAIKSFDIADGWTMDLCKDENFLNSNNQCNFGVGFWSKPQVSATDDIFTVGRFNQATHVRVYKSNKIQLVLHTIYGSWFSTRYKITDTGNLGDIYNSEGTIYDFRKSEIYRVAKGATKYSVSVTFTCEVSLVENGVITRTVVSYPTIIGNPSYNIIHNPTISDAEMFTICAGFNNALEKMADEWNQ